MVQLYEGDNTLNVQMVPIAAPVANLSGKVTDSVTGLALQGVKVTLETTVAYTDGSGNYGFTGFDPGYYPLTFEKAGYETVVM